MDWSHPWHTSPLYKRILTHSAVPTSNSSFIRHQTLSELSQFAPYMPWIARLSCDAQPLNAFVWLLISAWWILQPLRWPVISYFWASFQTLFSISSATSQCVHSLPSLFLQRHRPYCQTDYRSSDSNLGTLKLYYQYSSILQPSAVRYSLDSFQKMTRL